jgi:hypothetical protein
VLRVGSQPAATAGSHVRLRPGAQDLRIEPGPAPEVQGVVTTAARLIHWREEAIRSQGQLYSALSTYGAFAVCHGNTARSPRDAEGPARAGPSGSWGMTAGRQLLYALFAP